MLFRVMIHGGFGWSHLHVLENHIAVSVESLDARQELAVVSDGDENLGVAADGGLEDGEGSGAEFVLLELGDLVLGELVTRLGEKFPALRMSASRSFISAGEQGDALNLGVGRHDGRLWRGDGRGVWKWVSNVASDTFDVDHSKAERVWWCLLLSGWCADWLHQSSEVGAGKKVLPSIYSAGTQAKLEVRQL